MVKNDKPKIVEMLPLLVAVASLVVIFSILLAVNFQSQRAAQLKNLQKIQHDVYDRGQQFTFIVDDLHEKLTLLAGSNEVTAFFRNRSLGMSMDYGLRASLNNIHRYFQTMSELSQLGGGHPYVQIRLLDLSGEQLTQWSKNEEIPPPVAPVGSEKQVQMFSVGKFLYFSMPIYGGDVLQGYVQTIVSYQIIYNYLFSDTNDQRFITHRDNIVSHVVGTAPFGRVLTALRQQNITSPHKIEPLEPEICSFSAFRGIEEPLLFFTDLEKYPFSIYCMEDAGDIYNQVVPIMFLLPLVLFSTTVIVFSIRLVRSSTRNQVLNYSLLEVEKREAALAAKNQELELIIAGAELGTWLWNVQTDEIVINEQWLNMLGYDHEETVITNDFWRSLIHPDDLTVVEKIRSDHLAGKTKIYEIDHRLLHKSGQWIWVHDVGQVFSRDENGEPLLVMGIHLEITELKEAIMQAGQAQKEADSVISNFLDSLLVVDRNLIITRINKATCVLLGYSEDELLGKAVATIFREPDTFVNRYFGFPEMPDCEATFELRNIELSFLDRNGKGHPVSINLARLKNDRGDTVGVVAGAKDISVLKQALQKTEKQKLFIENILNIIPGGLLVLGENLMMLQRNHTFNDLIETWSVKYQLSAEELCQEILSSLTQKISASSTGEFCINSPNGDFYIEYHASGRIEDSEVDRVVFLHDVTDRHQVEASRRLQSTVLEQSSEAIIITDTEGIILYANDSAKDISGYSGSELLGQRTSLFKSGVHDEGYYRQLWETVLGGKFWHGSLTNRKKDGSLIEVESRISPVREERGGVTHFVSFWRDVSQEHTLQRQLLQAQKLEAVGQLAAGVAHEINTPIQYIQNNVTFFQSSFVGIDTLLDDLQQMLNSPELIASNREWQQLIKTHAEECDLEFLREEIPHGLNDVLEGIDHVAKIVSAMKEFSHPGGAEKVPTDLNRVIENTTVVTRNEWKYVAELKTELAVDLPVLTCDPGAWSQVFLNMIVNSAQSISEKSAPDGLGLIRLQTRKVGEEIEIQITDTGVGIAQENQDRIFEPFYTTKEIGKGTGQGLAIVYDLVVNKHSGSIVCSSESGDGATFTIRIPLNQQVE